MHEIALFRGHFGSSRCFLLKFVLPLRGVATSERTLAGDLRGRTRQPRWPRRFAVGRQKSSWM